MPTTTFKVSVLILSLIAQNAIAAEILVRYRSVGPGKTITRELSTDVVRIETEDTEADLESLLADPAVVYAEPDYAIRPAALPDDPYLHEPGFFYNYEISGVVEAWNSAQDCTGTIVAVLDSGIDSDHSDLKDNLWTNEGEIADNGVDDDDNGFVDDVHGFDFDDGNGDIRDGFGHGTAVAGIIGAVGNNGVGLSGVCWSARILPIKIFGDREGEGGNVSAALAAIDYAVDRGARILNLSWTLEGGESSLFLKEAIQKAGKAGVLVVTAAGNEGKDLATDPVYPAAYDFPNLMTVAAHDFEGGRPAFTNFGDGIVDIAAPGLKVITTTVNNGYFFFSGTSAAAPHVAGAAALLLSQDPDLEPEEVASLLKSSAEVETERLNVSQALAALNSNGSNDSDNEAPTLEENEEAPATGGGCGLLYKKMTH